MPRGSAESEIRRSAWRVGQSGGILADDEWVVGVGCWTPDLWRVEAVMLELKVVVRRAHQTSSVAVWHVPVDSRDRRSALAERHHPQLGDRSCQVTRRAHMKLRAPVPLSLTRRRRHTMKLPRRNILILSRSATLVKWTAYESCGQKSCDRPLLLLH